MTVDDVRLKVFGSKEAYDAYNNALDALHKFSSRSPDCVPGDDVIRFFGRKFEQYVRAHEANKRGE